MATTAAQREAMRRLAESATGIGVYGGQYNPADLLPRINARTADALIAAGLVEIVTCAGCTGSERVRHGFAGYAHRYTYSSTTLRLTEKGKEIL